MTFFYRYIDIHSENGCSIKLLDFYLVSETPKGFWICPSGISSLSPRFKKSLTWVSKTSRKRFAYPCPAAALQSFRARKEMQLFYGNRNTKYAHTALETLDALHQEKDHGI